MILQNLHTHTVYGDGKNTAEEMIQGALRSGCASLGFSEHSPLLPAADPDGWTMSPAREEAYRKEIAGLREKYAGQLDVFLGLEQDIDSPAPSHPYDYLIGSVHGIWQDGVYLPIDASPASFTQSAGRYFGGDYYAFAKAYYRREAVAAEQTRCQIVGHFDLFTKFNEGSCFFSQDDPRYRSASLEALEALLAQDVLFEINTGAISRGYRSAPYPSPLLLKAIREKGGRICITSDSHSAQAVTCAFPQAAELALSCGFRETWVLAPRGFQPVGLAEFLAEAAGAQGK